MDSGTIDFVNLSEINTINANIGDKEDKE